MKIKAQVKKGQFELPSLKTRDEWIDWAKSRFDFTTDKEREPLLVLLRELPDADDFSTVHRGKIMASIQKLLRDALPNLWMAIAVLAIAAIGGVYVFTNL